MSTKAIREALQSLKDEGGWDRTYAAAIAEVEAIENAARQWYGQETRGLVLESDALAPLERIALETERDDVAKASP